MTEELKNKIIAKLRQVARQEIKITFGQTDEPLPVGSSRIGGRPDVPSDFVWPTYEGSSYDATELKRRPLSFLAQINLRDVAVWDEEHLLPTEGILSFFYELETMQWGFDPKDEGSARVFWFPDSETLAPADFPDDMEQDFILPELPINCTPQVSLPDYWCMKLPDEVTWDDYYACCAVCDYTEAEDVTKLLGYPDVIQNPMEEECERVTRGYRCGNSEDYQKVPEAEKEDISAKASEWRLLFQMGTVETDGYELMFGDAGYIYFWIRREDLLNRRFDRIWLILQCY